MEGVGGGGVIEVHGGGRPALELGNPAISKVECG